MTDETKLNTTAPVAATKDRAVKFALETMTRKRFKSLVGAKLGDENLNRAEMNGAYKHVEYFNSPYGLIVFAHQSNGQVDGVHPAILSKSIEAPVNIIQTFGDDESYSVHWINRRWQGALLISAFGRVIHPDEAEAHLVETKRRFSLDMFSSPLGLIVGICEGENVHALYATAEEEAKVATAEAEANFAQFLLKNRPAHEKCVDLLRKNGAASARIEGMKEDAIWTLVLTGAK